VAGAGTKEANLQNWARLQRGHNNALGSMTTQCSVVGVGNEVALEDAIGSLACSREAFACVLPLKCLSGVIFLFLFTLSLTAQR
jgi:hypothetical protein